MAPAMSGNWRRRLRPRIIASHVIVVLLTTVLYAVSVVVLKERLESAAYASMLRSQLDAALREPDPDHYFDSPALHRWSLYRAGALLFLPREIRELEPGSHHSVSFDGRVWHLEVAMRRPPGAAGDGTALPEKMVLAYDITEWEQAEHAMLWWMGVGALLAVLLALLLGWLANAAIVAPITSLRRRLEALDPENTRVKLGPRFHGSEVGPIASAADRLLARIRDLVARERSFTSTASHELRSSLAVMQGALEVLDAQQPALAGHPALGRLRRALEEMHQFVEAALFLAREQSPATRDAGRGDMAAIVAAVVERYRDEALQKGLRLHLDLEGEVLLPVPATIAYIAVANLVRNALEHSCASDLFLHLNERALRIVDNGEGLPEDPLREEPQPDRAGGAARTGIGLALVQRICTRFDWILEVESRPGEGLRVALVFRPDALPGSLAPGGS